MKGTIERYVITSGQGSVEVGGLPPTNVLPGDIVVIPESEKQRITNTGDKDLIFFCVCTPRFQVDNYQDLVTESP